MTFKIILEKISARFFHIWHDSVWSKVIAGAILAGGGGFVIGDATSTTRIPQTVEPPKYQSTSFGPPSAGEIEQRNKAKELCPTDTNVDPRTQVEQVRDIPKRDERDALYAGLVVEAICRNEEGLSLDLLAHISSFYYREEAVRRIVNIHFAKKDYTATKRWARYLSDDADYGYWVKRILDATKKA